jgi:hypothetical protein
MRKCMSAPKMAVRDSHYNAYFINPELRYKKRTVDPKKVKRNLLNDHYVYNTLHDQDFHSWQHPFAASRQKGREGRVALGEEEVEKLVRFKQFVEQRGKGRVPALVEQFIREAAGRK